MRFLRKRFAALGLALFFCGSLAAAEANKTTTPKLGQKSAARAPGKPAAKKTPAKKTAPAKKAAPVKRATSNQGVGCRTVKVKTAKGWVNRRVCRGAANTAAPALRSPIHDNALKASPQADKAGEVKARTVPSRAYAVDGQTFFYQGRKYRVAGLKGNDNSDMAKQRLQRALESGDLALDSAQAEEGGVTTARVRINGRDIADDLN